MVNINQFWSYASTPDMSVCSYFIFLIVQPKHMLFVLKRTVSTRQFVWAQTTHVLVEQ